MKSFMLMMLSTICLACSTGAMVIAMVAVGYGTEFYATLGIMSLIGFFTGFHYLSLMMKSIKEDK